MEMPEPFSPISRRSSRGSSRFGETRGSTRRPGTTTLSRKKKEPAPFHSPTAKGMRHTYSAFFTYGKRDFDRYDYLGPDPAESRIKSVDNLIGPQTISDWKNPPQLSFGMSTREDWAKTFRAPDRNESLGPGSYECAESVGKQSLGNKKTFPMISFASSLRQDMSAEYNRRSPGPVYAAPEYMGKGYKPRIGTSTRPPLHDGDNCSPGPMYSIPVKSLPGQRRGPSVGFTKEKRFRWMVKRN